MDKQGVWLFDTAMLAGLFPKESMRTLNNSIMRHCARGYLLRVRKGLFANPTARSGAMYKLEAVVGYLRPDDINYISQESRLSDLGVISQIPRSHLTLMTTGRSQTFDTTYGTIEFTHTSRSPTDILDNCMLNKATGLLEASPDLALSDLKRARRNMNLVHLEDMEEAREDYKKLMASYRDMTSSISQGDTQ